MTLYFLLLLNFYFSTLILILHAQTPDSSMFPCLFCLFTPFPSKVCVFLCLLSLHHSLHLPQRLHLFLLFKSLWPFSSHGGLLSLFLELCIPFCFLISFLFSVDGGFNLRLASGTDPEPGRCRRTDGKKWRCSRDVAPNHKYCERHMHRGRPRSRKPVEVNTKTATPTCINNNTHQIKRPRHECNPFPPIPDVTVAISNPTSRKHGPSPHFLGSSTTLPYLESPLSLANFGYKAAHFDSMPSVSANKEPR